MTNSFTIRAARMDDLETAAELLDEHSRRIHGVPDQPISMLRQYWESPDVDFDRDVLVAEGPDGAFVGYADLGLHSEKIWLDVRGLEEEPQRALLEAMEARAAEKKPGAGLIGFAAEQDAVLRAVYEQAGYSVFRHSYRMEIGLEAKPPEPEWPEGLTVRTMREGEEKRVYEAHLTSFADAWMFDPEPYDVWSHWYLGDSAFDPSLWFLAEAGEELAGIALTKEFENEPGFGWVGILGVIPKFRRRGLAQALLRHTFAEHARRGFDRVGLGVDAQSPTGAVRVYERVGMQVSRTNLILEKVQG